MNQAPAQLPGKVAALVLMVERLGLAPSRTMLFLASLQAGDEGLSDFPPDPGSSFGLRSDRLDMLVKSSQGHNPVAVFRDVPPAGGGRGVANGPIALLPSLSVRAPGKCFQSVQFLGRQVLLDVERLAYVYRPKQFWVWLRGCHNGAE